MPPSTIQPTWPNPPRDAWSSVSSGDAPGSADASPGLTDGRASPEVEPLGADDADPGSSLDPAPWLSSADAPGVGVAGAGVTPGGSGVGRGVGRGVTPGGRGVGCGVAVGTGVGGGVGVGAGVGVAGGGVGAAVTVTSPPSTGAGSPGGSSTTSATNVTEYVPKARVSVDPAYVPFEGEPATSVSGTSVAPTWATIESGGRAGELLRKWIEKVNSCPTGPLEGDTDGSVSVLAARTGPTGHANAHRAAKSSTVQAATDFQAVGRMRSGTLDGILTRIGPRIIPSAAIHRPDRGPRHGQLDG